MEDGQAHDHPLEPALSVRQVLALERVLAGEPEVVAGAGQLDRSVRWVHVAEAADVGVMLSGGEMVLTTGVLLAGRPRRPGRVHPLAAPRGGRGRRPRTRPGLPHPAGRDAPGRRALRTADGGAPPALPLRRVDGGGPVPAGTAASSPPSACPRPYGPRSPDSSPPAPRSSACSTRSPSTPPVPSSSPTSPTGSSPPPGSARPSTTCCATGSASPGRPAAARATAGSAPNWADAASDGAGSCCAATGATRPPGGCSPTGPPRPSSCTACSAALRPHLGGAVRAEPADRPGQRCRTGPPAPAASAGRRTARQPPHLRAAGRTRRRPGRTRPCARLLGLPGLVAELSDGATAVLLSLARDQDAEALAAHFAVRLRDETGVPADRGRRRTPYRLGRRARRTARSPARRRRPPPAHPPTRTGRRWSSLQGRPSARPGPAAAGRSARPVLRGARAGRAAVRAAGGSPAAARPADLSRHRAQQVTHRAAPPRLAGPRSTGGWRRYRPASASTSTTSNRPPPCTSPSSRTTHSEVRTEGRRQPREPEPGRNT